MSNRKLKLTMKEIRKRGYPIRELISAKGKLRAQTMIDGKPRTITVIEDGQENAAGSGGDA